MARIGFFLVCWFFSHSIWGEASFSVKPGMKGEPLWQTSTYLEDPKSDFSPETIVSGERDGEFRPIRTPNLGFSASQFWLRIPIKNPGSEPFDWKLEFNFPIIDEVEIFGANANNLSFRKLGDSFPFTERNEEYRNPVFSLTEPALSESVYYLRIRSDSTIPLSLEAYSEKEFYSKVSKEQILFGLFYGTMLAMVFYNSFILYSTRESAYISYILFIVSISLFHLSNNGLAFQFLWSNSIWWANHALPFFMVLSCFTGTLFTGQFLDLFKSKDFIKKVLQFWLGALVFLSLPSFFFNYRIAIITAILCVVITAILLIIMGVKSYIERVRTARYYLFAWTLFLLGVFLFSFKSLGFLPDILLTRWSLQMGTGLLVVIFALGLADRINYLSSQLKESVLQLSQAKEKVEESEKRFKEIFEGSEEVILLLSEDQKVLSANRALSKLLGYKPQDILGRSLSDLIYQAKSKKDSYAKIFVSEKLKELFATGRPVQFQTEFAQKYVMEPRDLNCRIQFVDLGGSREILVTMSSMGEDAISRIIYSERIEFEMNNYLRNAEIVSQKITSQLHKFVDSMTQTEIRTSVREIIINAIEHGNLGIGFEEKTKAILEGNYLEYVQKRQEDPQFSAKKVRIDYVLNNEYIAFRITDEGNGFDHKKMMAKSAETVNETFEQHGRGIFMTKAVFDKIEYNDKGNQVSLVRFFKKAEEVK